MQGPVRPNCPTALQVLSSSGMYAELAALYKYNKQHAKGLQLLHALSQDAASLPVKPRGAAAGGCGGELGGGGQVHDCICNCSCVHVHV